MHNTGRCLETERYIAIARSNSRPTKEEKAHIQKCKWCEYFSIYTDENCFPVKRLLEIALGQLPSKEERIHAKECKAWCKYNFSMSFRDITLICAFQCT